MECGVYIDKVHTMETQCGIFIDKAHPMIKEIKVHQKIFKKSENVEKIYNITKPKIYLIHPSILYIFFKTDSMKKTTLCYLLYPDISSMMKFNKLIWLNPIDKDCVVQCLKESLINGQ